MHSPDSVQNIRPPERQIEKNGFRHSQIDCCQERGDRAYGAQFQPAARFRENCTQRSGHFARNVFCYQDPEIPFVHLYPSKSKSRPVRSICSGNYTRSCEMGLRRERALTGQSFGLERTVDDTKNTQEGGVAILLQTGTESIVM